MAKKSVESSEMENLGAEAMNKTEQFFEQNGKKLVTIIVAVLAVAVAIYGYQAVVIEPKEERAADMAQAAQTIIENGMPDYQLALNGDGSVIGFLEVIDNYGSTKTGNLAYHYAGICYLKLGDWANAKSYLSKYKAQKGIPAQIINAQNIGLLGDVAVEQGSYNEAIELFVKASQISTNDFTTPLYLRKAGMAAQAAGNKSRAKELYQTVVDLYPNTTESALAAKLMGTL